ncbi:phage scaffolding protein [Lactococcus lactis subsp. lactis]|uniref:phage scaffolding protein n=1 Tax=Lactococcus lactis TaxID=1358 RepID=UPI0026484F50|nr:phage scaffolding protein [Lactococcus lactis]WKB49233.1 phage scaffolding protein [Lactococcus lactis subsp. lactis]
MGLKRSNLEEWGITDKEVIDKIMDANGDSINETKATLDSEKTALQTQLDQQTSEIEELKKSTETSAETKKALDDLQASFDSYKTDAEKTLAETQKTNAVKLALKDSGTVNTELLFGQVNMDNVIIQDDGKVSGLDDQLATFKESMPYLFQEATGTAKPTIVPSGNPNPGAAGNKTLADKIQARLDQAKQ